VILHSEVWLGWEASFLAEASFRVKRSWHQSLTGRGVIADGGHAVEGHQVREPVRLSTRRASSETVPTTSGARSAFSGGFPKSVACRPLEQMGRAS
jgi:hypothetical protein